VCSSQHVLRLPAANSFHIVAASLGSGGVPIPLANALDAEAGIAEPRSAGKARMAQGGYPRSGWTGLACTPASIRLLRSIGWTVKLVNSGPEVRLVAREFRPEAVVCDL